MNAVADPGKVAAILPHSTEVLQAGLMGQSLNGVDLGTATLADFLISQKVK